MNDTVVGPKTDAAPVVTVGANFAGSNIAVSGFYPPDSDGAVGPSQFVELVNGVYRVYDKSGTVLQQLSLDQFWSSAGATPQGFAGDPRILYDPESQRWFAAALDFSSGPPDNPSAYLLAVSNTSDPTQGWQVLAPERISLTEAAGYSGCAGAKMHRQLALCEACKGRGMKGVELYGRVRYAVRIEGLSRREAARRFGLDPRTVAKMLAFSVPPGYRRSRPAARPKLDRFVGIIDQILEDDKARPAKQRPSRSSAHLPATAWR